MTDLEYLEMLIILLSKDEPESARMLAQLMRQLEL